MAGPLENRAGRGEFNHVGVFYRLTFPPATFKLELDSEVEPWFPSVLFPINLFFC